MRISHVDEFTGTRFFELANLVADHTVELGLHGVAVLLEPSLFQQLYVNPGQAAASVVVLLPFFLTAASRFIARPWRGKRPRRCVLHVLAVRAMLFSEKLGMHMCSTE